MDWLGTAGRAIDPFLHNVPPSPASVPAHQTFGCFPSSSALACSIGRPDLDELFSRVAALAAAAGEARVAVMACGPESLLRAVSRHAAQRSTTTLQFDVHTETFDF